MVEWIKNKWLQLVGLSVKAKVQYINYIYLYTLYISTKNIFIIYIMQSYHIKSEADKISIWGPKGKKLQNWFSSLGAAWAIRHLIMIQNMRLKQQLWPLIWFNSGLQDFKLCCKISSCVARFHVGLQFLQRLCKVLPGCCGPKARF